MSSSCLTFSRVPRIAVIGAGVSGALCAQALAQAGARVELFDKARGPGGRMATRRHGEGVQTLHFDHGATGFESHSLALQPWIRRGAQGGWLAPWRAQRPDGVDPVRWVAVPGMNEMVRQLIGDLPLQLGQPVSGLLRQPRTDETARRWLLQRGEQPGLPRSHDAVVLAMPPQQAAVLLEAHRPDWAEAARQVEMEPCWTLMAETDELPAWPASLLRPAHGPIALLLRDDHKPGRQPRPGRARWVVQARPEWSHRHQDDRPEQIVARLLDALRAEVNPGGDLPVHVAMAHRWLYSRPCPLLRAGPSCWWDAELGLGVCGDFLGGGTVELAALSGLDLAERIGREPPHLARAQPASASSHRQEQPA
ncbi:MAG: hypothetical protein RL654_630 [Pseudomonadota bacterium]|jgi:predicted NAD/FAD-dependent oxidoreductase